MSEHARAVSRTPSSMSTTVSGLVRKGLLSRERDEEHGRMVYLRLTRRGTRVLAKARAARTELGAQT